MEVSHTRVRARTHERAHTHTLGCQKRKEIHTHFLRVVSVQINNILSFCESCLPSCWFAFQRRRYPPSPAPPHLLLLLLRLLCVCVFFNTAMEAWRHTSHCCRGRKDTSLLEGHYLFWWGGVGAQDVWRQKWTPGLIHYTVESTRIHISFIILCFAWFIPF